MIETGLETRMSDSKTYTLNHSAKLPQKLNELSGVYLSYKAVTIK